MSDYDQLIKDKINSKQYAYSAKNWQNFTKKAGWRRGFSLTQWLLTGAAVVAVAASGYLAYRLLTNEPQQTEVYTQENPLAEEAVTPAEGITESTVERETEIMADAQTNETVVQSVTTGKSTTTNSTTKPGTTPNTSSALDTDTVATSHEPAQKPIRKDRVTRIFVIDPDTIPSNDF